MRTARCLLILLLAVLLPIRGAMGAAALCPVGGLGSQSATASLDGDWAATSASEVAHDMTMASHHHRDGDAPKAASTTNRVGHHGAGEHSTRLCSSCAAFCSGVALPSSAAAIPEAHGLAGARLPEIAASVLTFMVGGQDRPPRSI